MSSHYLTEARMMLDRPPLTGPQSSNRLATSVPQSNEGYTVKTETAGAVLPPLSQQPPPPQHQQLPPRWMLAPTAPPPLAPTIHPMTPVAQDSNQPATWVTQGNECDNVGTVEVMPPPPSQRLPPPQHQQLSPPEDTDLGSISITQQVLYDSAKSLKLAFKQNGIDPQTMLGVPSAWVELRDGKGTCVRIVQAKMDVVPEHPCGYNFGLPVFYQQLAARGWTIEHYGGPGQRMYGIITLQWAEIILFCPMKHAWPYCLRCDRFLYPPNDHRNSTRHCKARGQICHMTQEAGMADTHSWLQFRIGGGSRRLETSQRISAEWGL